MPLIPFIKLFHGVHTLVLNPFSETFLSTFAVESLNKVSMAWYQTLVGVTSSSSPSSFAIESSWMVDSPTSLGLAAFFLDGDMMAPKVGKIASGQYALLENKLENLKLES